MQQAKDLSLWKLEYAIFMAQSKLSKYNTLEIFMKERYRKLNNSKLESNLQPIILLPQDSSRTTALHTIKYIYLPSKSRRESTAFLSNWLDFKNLAI